jgi:hypothetical protein
MPLDPQAKALIASVAGGKPVEQTSAGVLDAGRQAVRGASAALGEAFGRVRA